MSVVISNGVVEFLLHLLFEIFSYIFLALEASLFWGIGGNQDLLDLLAMEGGVATAGLTLVGC